MESPIFVWPSENVRNLKDFGDLELNITEPEFSEDLTHLLKTAHRTIFPLQGIKRKRSFCMLKNVMTSISRSILNMIIRKNSKWL